MALFHVGDGSIRARDSDRWRVPARTGSTRRSSHEHRVLFKSTDQQSDSRGSESGDVGNHGVCSPLAVPEVKVTPAKVRDKPKVHTSMSMEEEEHRVEEIRNQVDWRKRFWSYFKIIVSVVSHLGFLGCIAVITWSRQQGYLHKQQSDRYYRYYLISSSFAGFFYIVILVEAAACDTYRYIRNFCKTQSAEEYIQRVKEARPQIRWQAECYHYEIRSQTRIQRDARGNVNVRQLRHKEKMGTHKETEAFKFFKWKDLTRDIEKLLDTDVVRIECSKVFIFKDTVSKERYLEQYIAFRERNRKRDEFMEHEEDFHLPGYEERLTACVRAHKKPCYLSELWFWLITMLLLTWPYRWLFRRLSSKVYVTFIKELEV